MLVWEKIPVDRSVHGAAEHGEAGSHGGEKALIFILLGATHLSVKHWFRRSDRRETNRRWLLDAEANRIGKKSVCLKRKLK